ncbi:hypothetical protein VNI00_009859 [Paramarasmius palmivorus]|uniref:Uncharacterized protein n=1 Tax=Paramarasmius palmivorus TaxID=297713 RepID=A0AAW0CPG3_9AGAR
MKNTVSQKRKSGSTSVSDSPPKRGRFSSILDSFSGYSSKSDSSTPVRRTKTATSSYTAAAAAAPKASPICTLSLDTASVGRVLDVLDVNVSNPQNAPTHFPSQASPLNEDSGLCRSKTLPSCRVNPKTKTNVDALFKGSGHHRRRRCSSGLSISTLSDLATRNPELGIVHQRTPHVVEPRLVSTMRRVDPKLIAAVRRSVEAASMSSLGSSADGFLAQDLVLAKRLGVYLDEYEWRDQEVFTMDVEDEDEYTMEVDSNAFSLSKPRSYSLPPSPTSPVSPLERTLSLEQLVATLTLKHREKSGVRKGLDGAGRSKQRRASGLKVELQL